MRFSEWPLIRKILARNDGRRILLICASALVVVIVGIIIAAVVLQGGGKAAEASADVPEITEAPSETPAVTLIPTAAPTVEPTVEPTAEPAATEEPTPAPSEEPTPAPAPFTNFLTGEPLFDETAALRRPVAIVINNAPKSLPQYGISQASLYYEVLAEGELTRIITLFQDFDAAKIGSIRSARHYFLNFAYDNDAIFMHYGGSPLLYAAVANPLCDNLDGMRGSGSIIWRDLERYNTKGMSEHSAYVTAADIFPQIERIGYRVERKATLSPLFKFYPSPSSRVGAKACNAVTVPYLPNMAEARFEYNAADKKYYKFQNGKKHTDGDEQLAVTNVIIQRAKITLIPNDPEGRRDVELVGSGTGYLLTDGAYVPVKWSKAADTVPTVWTFEDGSPLTLNVGKTWVSVISKDRDIVFEE